MLAKIQEMIDVLSERLAWLPPLLARLVAGIFFLQSGWGKLHNLEQVTSFFTDLGIPAPGLMAPFVAGTEFVGGILLLGGLLTRVAAGALAIAMIVATITARWAEVTKAGGLWDGLGTLFGFIEVAYIVIFVWLAVAGAGALSLDRLFKKSPTAPPVS